MSDLTASIEDGREVSELKVVELREELGKRGLSKTGNKQQLADRLREFLITGTGEVSDKSTPNSPVKSPVNNLIAQYRSTQQQILKDAHKDTEPTKGEEPTEPQQEETPNEEVGIAENGQGEAEEVKAQTPEPAEELPTKVEEVPDEPTPAEEQSPPPEVKEVPQNNEKVIEEIPKALSPVGGDRTRSSTPEREVKTPVKAVTKEDQAISDEEEEEEKAATPEKVTAPEIQQVSDDEGEAESPPQSPKNPREEVTHEEKPNINNKEIKSNKASHVDDRKSGSPSEESKRKSIVYTEGIVYVKEEPLARKASTVSQVEEDRTPEGFLRSKAVSPAREDPTNIIYVRGMKRPFNPNQWHGVLSKFGTVDVENDVWLNNVKSESIVRFATVDEAKNAREGIHHILWPEGNGCELLVSFTEEEEFIERKGIIRKVIKQEERSNGRDEVRAGKKRERSLSPMQEELPTLKDVRREKRRTEPEDEEEPVPKKKKETKNLEDLFRKTTARPHLYYLPLSEEEAARRQAEKAIQKREVKEPSLKPEAKRSSPSPLPARSRRSRSPPPAKRQRSRSRSPIRRGGRSRSPIRRGRRDSPPPRRGPRSPRRASPSSKRRSPSPPSRSKPAKPSASPPPRRRSPASPVGKK